MKKRINQYYTLLFLALLFAAPGIAAYLFYQHPGWLSASTVNRGTLLTPPVVLKAFGDKAKWRIVYWSPALCDAACLDDVDKIARIRLALGRKLYEVDLWLMLGDKATPLTQSSKTLLEEKDFHWVQLTHAQQHPLKSLSGRPAIYLVNPDQYLILTYPVEVRIGPVITSVSCIKSEHPLGLFGSKKMLDGPRYTCAFFRSEQAKRISSFAQETEVITGPILNSDDVYQDLKHLLNTTDNITPNTPSSPNSTQARQ